MNRIQHALITRFSIRNLFGDGGGDALLPSSIERRFALFQVACLPSVLAQSSQDFDWFVFVDPALQRRDVERMESLISLRDRSHVVPYRGEPSYHYLDWLRPHMNADANYVMTTILDDDDALRTDYVQYLQMHAALQTSQRQVPVQFIGCAAAVHWNLKRETHAPWGKTRPWTCEALQLVDIPFRPDFHCCQSTLGYRWASANSAMP